MVDLPEFDDYTATAELDTRPPIAQSLYEWRESETGADLFVNAIKRGYVVRVDERPNWFGYVQTLSITTFVSDDLDMEAVKRTVVRAVPPAVDCKAMFCTLTSDSCDGLDHVDVTGHSWFEDTREYAGPIIAHVHGEEL